MKEKIQEHKKELMAAGGAIAVMALGFYGMRKAYHRGFQRGCDVLFYRMAKEFPDINFMDFWNKYHL